MTISRSQISTPPHSKRLAGASLSESHPPASKFLIGTFDISEFDSSSSKQSRSQISNGYKNGIVESLPTSGFQLQRHHRDHKNLVQCGTALMATRLSPSHDSPLESQVET